MGTEEQAKGESMSTAEKFLSIIVTEGVTDPAAGRMIRIICDELDAMRARLDVQGRKIDGLHSTVGVLIDENKALVARIAELEIGADARCLQHQIDLLRGQIAASTVPEIMAADAGKVDVAG